MQKLVLFTFLSIGFWFQNAWSQNTYLQNPYSQNGFFQNGYTFPAARPTYSLPTPYYLKSVTDARADTLNNGWVTLNQTNLPTGVGIPCSFEFGLADYIKNTIKSQKATPERNIPVVIRIRDFSVTEFGEKKKLGICNINLEFIFTVKDTHNISQIFNGRWQHQSTESVTMVQPAIIGLALRQCLLDLKANKKKLSGNTFMSHDLSRQIPYYADNEIDPAVREEFSTYSLFGANGESLRIRDNLLIEKNSINGNGGYTYGGKPITNLVLRRLLKSRSSYNIGFVARQANRWKAGGIIFSYLLIWESFVTYVTYNSISQGTNNQYPALPYIVNLSFFGAPATYCFIRAHNNRIKAIENFNRQVATDGYSRSD